VGFYKLIFLLSDRLGGTVQAKTPPLSGRLGGALQANIPLFGEVRWNFTS